METLNEVQTNKIEVIIMSAQLFDDNVKLNLNKVIEHINQHNEVVEENWLSVSKAKALSLIPDLKLLTIGNEMPDYIFNLLPNLVLSVEKKEVLKGETVNGFTFDETGYYFDIVVKKKNWTKIQDVLFNTILNNILEGKYAKKKEKKEIEIPKFDNNKIVG